MAHTHKLLGRWNDATKAFRKAIEINAYQALTYYNLGLVYKEMKDTDSAITAYNAAMRLKTDFTAAHYQLGLLYAATVFKL